MEGVGLAYGFVAAFFQSLSYLGSCWYLRRSGGTSLQLLGMSHLWMGLAAVALFPLLARAGLPPLRIYFLPALGAIGFYMIGQAGFFVALKRTDSSRLAPLLGLKVFILAVISVAALGKVLNGWQWAAVALSVVAAFVLNESGGRLPVPAMLAVGVAVVGYSLSDLSIKSLVTALEPAGSRAALVGVCVTYMMGAGAGIPLAAGKRALEPRLWLMALPYAAAWFVSMLFLYIAFARIGVVFGNIVQSTRGLMSIGLGVWVVRLGLLDLETRVPRRVVARRLAGAALMTAAIALYLKH